MIKSLAVMMARHIFQTEVCWNHSSNIWHSLPRPWKQRVMKCVMSSCKARLDVEKVHIAMKWFIKKTWRENSIDFCS